jgi:hypothetical protein
MTFNNLNLQLEAGIGMLTINRPKKTQCPEQSNYFRITPSFESFGPGPKCPCHCIDWKWR